ncbi:uncharacterized protein LOC118506307 [Anopheles stephensi]|uniref:uncharacterized protein LOC118506307 n=1 Tax=Anopheles stephensi TaxID=30069 RepID=UPI00165890E0|nr:uncharacterized protein LOC118506307 [Anopheles stephensi]
MGRISQLVVALLLVLSIASIPGTIDAQDVEGPVVDIEGLGSVLGIMGETAWTARPIYQFFNIRYAEAPVGEQRFRAPVSVLPWSGVMDVTAPGRGCPQSRSVTTDDPDAEDCLTLSVFSNDLLANRPVMVYIHGGAFVVGSAERFGPEYLLEKDIVLVVIQYRLGTLGFLSTGTERIPGNAAMYDVMESLEWVSRHIRHFGGSPQDVTIFGESAGGHAVSAMLHSPQVREDLFQRAIIQSGTLFMPWVICQDPTEGAYEIASIIGCPLTSPTEIDDCLKQASVRDLVQAQDQHKRNEFSSPGYPKVAGACITIGGPLGDKNFMPVHPKESTYFRDVPIIFGMNSQEGLIFFNEYFQYALNSQPIEFANHWDFLEFVKTVNVKFGSGAFVDAVVGYELLSKATWEEMSRANFSELVPVLIDIAGNLALKYGSAEEANRFANAHPGKVYLYNFDYVGPPSPMTPGFPYDVPNSVGHGDELKFLFPMSNNLGDVHVQMAKIMVDLWTSFAITGVPQADNVIPWPTVSRPFGPYLRLVNPPEQKEYFVNELTNTVEKARAPRESSAVKRCLDLFLKREPKNVESNMGRLQHSVAALLLVLSITSITGTTKAQDAQGPVVDIEGLGSVLGIMGETAWTARPIYKFFNIKYAEAPVGEQRFRAPVSVLPWSGVMNVTAPGRGCPQSRTLSAEDPDAEDCLTLSVYSNDLLANRPVMLYIHGGAFVLGSAERFGPEYLLEKDIVLVVIQYRLGTLGFLSTGTERIPGNAAMYDVMESLEWVSRHIRHFGGNPQDVTIFGESAGGHAVSAMLHSPQVREDLFHRAIIQSGTVFMPWVICQDPTEGSYDIARIIGCPMTSPTAIDNCLKQASVRDLVQAQDQHKRNEFSSPGYPKVAGACITVGGPFGDKNFMPVHPKESTYFRNVSIIFGMNSQEGLIFFNEYFQYALNSEQIEFEDDWDFLEFVETVNVKFGSAAFVDAVVGYELLSKATWEEMSRTNFLELVPILIDIAGNLALKYGSVEEANRFARALPGQVYLYNFDYVGPPSPMTPGFPYDVPNSVGHGDELKFLFPSNNLNEEHTQMAKIMVDLWTSFAITGVPQGDNLIPWPTVSRPFGPYLRLVNPPEQKEYFVNELTNTVEKARAPRESSAVKRCLDLFLKRDPKN